MPRCTSVHPHAHMCPHTPHTKIFYHAGTMRTRERSIMGKNRVSSKGKIARVWRQVHREGQAAQGHLESEREGVASWNPHALSAQAQVAGKEGSRQKIRRKFESLCCNKWAHSKSPVLRIESLTFYSGKNPANPGNHSLETVAGQDQTGALLKN